MRDALRTTDLWVEPKAEKRATIHTIRSGGKRRDASLEPIKAAVKQRLIALAAEHSNRPTVTKYSDDQPRDDHGRWTSDGGGESVEAESSIAAGVREYNDRLRTAKPDYEAALTAYAKAHPGTDISGKTYGLDGMKDVDPRVGLEAINRLDELQRQFPSVKISAIGMASETVGSHEMPLGRMAETIPGGFTRASDISLSPTYWQSDPKSLYADDNGFRVPGTDNPAGDITHEFGHALEFALEWDQKYEHEAPVRDFYKKMFDVPSPSGYGQKSNAERFAETFAAAMTPASSAYNDPAPSALRDMLRTTGFWKAPKGA
jgi:hypothetical protein